MQNICEQEGDSGDAAAITGDDLDYEYDDDGDGDGNGRCSEDNRRSSWCQQAGRYDTDRGSGSNSCPTLLAQQRLRGRCRHRNKNNSIKKLQMRPVVGFRAHDAELDQLRHDILTRRKTAAVEFAAAEKAAAEATIPRPKGETEEDPEDDILGEKPAETWAEGSGDGGSGRAHEEKRSAALRDHQDDVGVGSIDRRGLGDENDCGGAVGFDNIGDVGGPTVGSSGSVSENGGCTGDSGGHSLLPLMMRICSGSGHKKVEFSAVFHEDAGSASNKRQENSSRRIGARDDPCRRRSPSTTAAETWRTFSGEASQTNDAKKSAPGGGGGGGERAGLLLHVEGRKRRPQLRIGGLAKGRRAQGVGGENVVEKQRKYALGDRYLRCFPPLFDIC